MRTGKYKILILAAFLFAAFNFNDVKAGNEVILVKPRLSQKELKTANNQSMIELKEAVKDMKYQLLCAQNEIMKLQDINQSLTKALSQSEVKSQMIDRQRISLENEIIGLKNQLSVSSGNVESLGQQLAALNNELIRTRQEYSSTNTKVGTIVSDKDIQIQNLSNKIALLNNELIKTREIHNLALNKHKELENMVALANKRADDIAAQNSFYRTKAESLSQQLVSLNNELSKIRQERLSTTVNDKDAEINLLQSKLSFSEKQLQDTSYKIDALKSDLEKTRQIYSSAINRQKELENLITLANKRADDILNEKNTQLDELKKELTSIKQSNISSAVQKEKENSSYQKPVADYNAVDTDNTKSADDYYNIAQAYQYAKDYKEAINNYKRAVAVNSSFSNAYKEMGLIYAQIGDYTNSYNSLNKCLIYSNNPKEQEVIRNFIRNIEGYANLGKK